jgi:excisionase family DNA binding protein
MPDPQEPITVTVKQAEQKSGLGHTTIYDLIAKGELKTVLIGRRRLIDYASLKARLAPQSAA